MADDGKLKIYEGLRELAQTVPLIVPMLPNLTLEVWHLNEALLTLMSTLEDDMVQDVNLDDLLDGLGDT